MIGQTISHYRILEKLGGGGMGVVYKAEDTKLKRTVALKFLPPSLTTDPESKERFIHEAQAASLLQHNNICNVHDIDETPDGQMFIVMDLYEGETLKKKIERGRLKIDEALDIATQVTQGLAKAHEHGIVHRDIKPANIIVTTDGVAKIVDFGLAKLSGRSMLTKKGSTLGTAAYMSPEQARGEEVDHRTDIWSLGVVLYEMLTGLPTFAGEYEQGIIYKILNEEPAPITSARTGIPVELKRIVNKCLEKKGDERYQTAVDLNVDLRHLHRTVEAGTETTATASKRVHKARWWYWVTALIVIAAVFLFEIPRRVTNREEKSMAVLPFVDMSPQKDQEYFCDGITEELINRLSKVQDLRVPARTSAFMFKGKTEDIRDIGSKLNVRTVLEGSVRKAGNGLRITAQLINVVDGYHLWSETYDRELKDVFAIQDEISSAIVNALKLRLTAQEKQEILATRHNLNPEAHNLYLQGRYFRYRNTYEDVVNGLPYFQRAIEKDSTYALGWSGLADIYLMIDLLSGSQPKYHAQSLVAAQRALALDPILPEAHTALGIIRMCYEGNWSGAQESAERAIELDPNAGRSHLELGVILQRTGRFEASIAEFKRGIELDPLAWASYLRLGISYSEVGNHKLAIEQFMKAVELSPTPEWTKIFQTWIGWEHFRQGSYEKAREFFDKIPELEVSVESARGDRQKGLAWIAKVQMSDMPAWQKSLNLARAFSCIGENDKAIVHLERVYELYPMVLVDINLYYDFKGLYSHPRFVALLKKIGLHD